MSSQLKGWKMYKKYVQSNVNQKCALTTQCNLTVGFNHTTVIAVALCIVLAIQWTTSNNQQQNLLINSWAALTPFTPLVTISSLSSATALRRVLSSAVTATCCASDSCICHSSIIHVSFMYDAVSNPINTELTCCRQWLYVTYLTDKWTRIIISTFLSCHDVITDDEKCCVMPLLQHLSLCSFRHCTWGITWLNFR